MIQNFNVNSTPNWMDGTTIVTAVVAGVAWIEYKKNQKWNQVKLAKELLDDLFSNEKAKEALFFLDWRAIKTESWLGRSSLETVKIDEIAKVLEKYEKPPESFTEKEIRILEAMDELFKCLEKISRYLDAKLIDFESIDEHLSYYLKQIQKIDSSIMAKYFERYHYPGTEKILNGGYRTDNRQKKGLYCRWTIYLFRIIPLISLSKETANSR